MIRNKICMWILNVVIVTFCIAGCGKNPSGEVSFVLPNADAELGFQKTVEEETTQEEITEEETTQEETTIERIINIPHKEEIELLIEKYNEAERLFSGDLTSNPVFGDESIPHESIYAPEHRGDIRLKIKEYNTLEGLDIYWRRYFTAEAYKDRFGFARERNFFEFQGYLCMEAVIGFPDRIIYESVSDWVETDEGMEACFDMRTHNCLEDNHFDRIRITFVWEDDTIKIGKILDLETHE